MLKINKYTGWLHRQMMHITKEVIDWGGGFSNIKLLPDMEDL